MERHVPRCLTVAALLAITALPAPADESHLIRARARYERERSGLTTSAERLERAQWASRSWWERAAAKDAGPGWVSLGPNNGAGRATSVAPHPVATGTVLVGTAGGGVWRTTDGGTSWQPLTDSLPDLSVGAVVYAPSDPTVVYLGTGEGGYAVDFIPGIGLLRSEDGGDTWQLPLEADADQFFDLDVHPNDADRLLAATDRGLLASDDGGATWRTLLADPSLVGVTEVVRASHDTDRIWAALWCDTICPAGLARIMRSDDAGTTWTAAESGLPPTAAVSLLNRTALAVAPSAPDTLYVALTTFAGVSSASWIYRSDDGGGTWTNTGPTMDYLGQQGWYDNTLIVHPADPETVVAGGVAYVRSSDGGRSWELLDPYAGGADGMGTPTLPHVDGQDLAWQGDRLWLACDGGVWTSDDAGRTWQGRNDGLITRQFYGLAIDPSRPEVVLGGTQDNESNLRRPDDDGSWENVLHSDGFECAINPLVPELMLGTVFGTQVYRSWSAGVGAWEDVSPSAGSDRRPFLTPLTMRPDRPWVVYTGTHRVWRSEDAGSSWTVLPVVVGNGTWSDATVRAIAVTPADAERLLVAKGDEVLVSDDGGRLWTASPLPATVNNVALSPVDPDVALACLARTGSDPVVRTDDGGVTWRPSGDGLPPFAVQVARWHPTDPTTVYAGTDVGLYRSSDGGRHWQPIGDGLPAASVHDIRMVSDGSRIVVASHGRGAWELLLPDPANRAPEVVLTGGLDAGRAVIGDDVAFEARAVDPDDDAVDLEWILDRPWRTLDGPSGDGSVSGSLAHRFTRAGRHVVSARATDGIGASGAAGLLVTAYEPGDDCSTPRVLPGDGPFPAVVASDTAEAGVDGADPEVGCTATVHDPDSGRWGSIWFELTPTLSGRYEISTCGSDVDTVLSVWTGPACGPYEPVAGGCNNDDDFVHCSGRVKDSWLALDLDGGQTYRILLGTWEEDEAGPIRLTVDCADCGPPSPASGRVVPAVANIPGAGGTSWTSDLVLSAPDGDAIAATLLFRRAGAGSLTREVVVPGGGTILVDDVVGGLFAAEGAGSLEIEAETALVVSSRTATTESGGGTFGQGIPALPAERAVVAGGTVRLGGLVNDGRFRTNLGLVNLATTPAELQIDIRSADGDRLARWTETLPAHGWRQLNRVLDGVGAGSVEEASAVVRHRSLSGRALVYASVVDEVTGDPAFVGPTEPADGETVVWVPAVAHVDGVGGATWRSDLTVVAIGEGDARFAITLLGDDGTPRTLHLGFEGGSSHRFADVVRTLFGADGAGSIRIVVAEGHLLVTSRTFTTRPVDAGSYGQFIPGVPEVDAVSDDAVGIVAGLRQSAAYRSNLGMVNVTPFAVQARVTYVGGNGQTLGSERWRLPGHGRRQATGALPVAADVASAHIEVETPGGRVLAYASVIDNRTGDPTYLPAEVLRAE